jgi:hypothetical protein
LTVMYENNTVSPGGELIPRPGMSHSLSSRRSRPDSLQLQADTHHQKPHNPRQSRPQYGSPTSKAPADASSSWSTSTYPVTTRASNSSTGLPQM